MGTDDRQVPLSDAGEDILASVQHAVKRNRAPLLVGMIEDVFDEAVRAMSEDERRELSRRMFKLFTAQFKTPEMDKACRDLVRARARVATERMVEDFAPRIEAGIRRWAEDNWEGLAADAARALLADALEAAGKVFHERIVALVDSVTPDSLKEHK